MTALMAHPPSHFVLPSPAPRQGILLNRSPSSSAPNSPKKYAAHLIQRPSSGGPHTLTTHPHPSSQSSASSATSSTDDLNSSTSATSAQDVLSPDPSSSTRRTSTSKTAPSSRRIRFAPLPETGRDYDDDPSSPAFWTDIDSAQSSPHASVVGFLSPPPLPQITSPTPMRASTIGAAQDSHAAPSTLGLSLTNESSDHADSGLSTETNTIAGSECGTDDTHTATAARQRSSSKWARLLRLPKAAPLAKATGGFRSPDAESSSAVNLSRCNSRESTVSLGSMRNGGIFGWASLSDNGSSTSLGALTRRKSHGTSESLPSSPAIRGTLPLRPVTSERGTMSTAALTPRNTKPRSGSNAGAPSNAAQAGPVRRGTRLLNGRIYGAKRQQQFFQQKNPFANVHDDAEFVEWGHGGMGSTKSVGGKTNYAALQSSNKLSIGHVEGGRVADDDDDGSGMGWVKRRREQREREKKEQEEREAAARSAGEAKVEGENTDDAAPASMAASSDTAALPSAPKELSDNEPTSSPAIDVLPVPAVESPLTTPSTPSPEAPPTPQPRGRLSAEDRDRREREKDKEYVYTAVTVPAPRPHHHHHHHQHAGSHAHSAASSLHASPHHSAMPTPTREVSSGSVTLVSAAAAGSPGPGPSPLGLTGMGPSAGEGSALGLGLGLDGSVEAGAEDGRKEGEATSPSEGSLSSPPESSASSSFDGEGEAEDDEDADADSAEKEEDGREEEDEDELMMRMRAKTQADAAGVEKISRHKPEHNANA